MPQFLSLWSRAHAPQQENSPGEAQHHNREWPCSQLEKATRSSEDPAQSKIKEGRKEESHPEKMMQPGPKEWVGAKLVIQSKKLNLGNSAYNDSILTF